MHYRAILSLNHQNRQRLDKMQDLVNDLVQKGMSPFGDTIMLAAERHRLQIEQNQYEGQISRGCIKLAEWTGQSTVEVHDTSWLLQMPDSGVKMSIAMHPMEKMASSTYDLENIRLQVLEKNYKPKLTLWGGSFARGSGVDRNLFTGLGFQRINYGIGAHIGVPLFYKTEKETLLHQQTLRVRAATERINHVKLSLQRQAELAQSIYEEALFIATQIPILIYETKKVLETSQDRYQRGLITLNEVIQNQFQLQKAESEQGMARLQVWKALLLKAYAHGDLSLFLNSKK
jgi:outer membrane protein TolC